MKNKIFSIVFLVSILFTSVSSKAMPEELVLKTIISNQNIYKNHNKNVVKVTEFFYYGCIHCFRMEPFVQKWKKDLPKEIDFERVPAVFPKWERGARIYYTALELGVEEEFTPKFFDLVIRDREPLNEKTAYKVLAKLGVDEGIFYKTYNSFKINAKVNRARKMGDTLEINSVPSFVVNYKYTTDVPLSGSKEEVFKTIEDLVKFELKGN